MVGAACETTSNSLKVSWKKPDGSVTGYKVALSPKDSPDDPEVRILAAERTSVEFGSLPGGTTYLVGIRTLDGQKESPVVEVEGAIADGQSESDAVDVLGLLHRGWSCLDCCRVQDSASISICTNLVEI